MKINKNIFAISLGAAMLMAMVIVVSMVSVPTAPLVANADRSANALILASADSLTVPQAGVDVAKAAQPMSIPVPCPIWMIGQLVGYGKTANQTADGAAASPNLVPGGIWIMQKFSEAALKIL